MAKILVSYPVLGRPNLRSIQSLYSAINNCKEHDITIHSSENDSMISRVRNVHISSFINDYKDYDYFVSIDSDLEILNKFTTNNIFSKLVSHGAKFVGGLYALKKPGEKQCASVPMDRNLQPEFNSGLKQMLWLSSGCWCLHRSAVEKMIKSYPELTYDGDDNMAGKKVHGLYIPYVQTIHKFNKATQKEEKVKKYLSEDWAFCQRWRDIGGQIFADTSIVLNHFGEKSHPMWNVEVVVRKRDQVQKLPKIEKLPNNLPSFPSNNLPQPGFDIGGDDE